MDEGVRGHPTAQMRDVWTIDAVRALDVEAGTWASGEVARLTEPFSVEIDLARLVVGT